MADPNDLLEQLRLARLKLIQDETSRIVNDSSEPKYQYSQADYESNRKDPVAEGYRKPDYGAVDPIAIKDGWFGEAFRRNELNDLLNEEKELEQLPTRFQQLFTPIKGSK